MLQRTRELLTLVLLAALPFHALLVTVGTRLLEGPGHAPLTFLALWKEVLLAVILLLAFIEWLRTHEGRWRLDRVDLLILLFIIIALIVTIRSPGAVRPILFGFKYDFIPLLAFFALRRVAWSTDFLKRSFRLLLWVGGIIAGIGLLTLFLPQKIFTLLGYSDLHSLYVPDAPLAAYQQVESLPVRRIQSTLSGPNQLGLWILIPWTLGIVSVLKSPCPADGIGRFLHIHENREFCLRSLYVILIGCALFFTFSRSAWIAAFIILFVGIFDLQSRDAFRRSVVRLAGLSVMLLALVAFLAPGALLKTTSSREHLVRPLQAFNIMMEYPWGLGLGTAGPASNRVSDSCVYLEAGADTSWAQDRPALCVFVGGTQVQPLQPCHCPFLPENWYLQIGVELGILGFLLFITLTIVLLWKLRKDDNGGEVFLIALGVALAALLLHAWEDSALAYSIWVLAAVALSAQHKEHRFTS